MKKSMQEVFEKTPDKPKPQQPKQYPTRRTNYGKRKLDENAPITQIKELEDGVRNVVIEGNILMLKLVSLNLVQSFFLAKYGYSDSIAFKKFVSNKDEIEELSAIKPGTGLNAGVSC